MNEEAMTQDIQRGVLERLHREKISMHSRAYFGIRLVLLALLSIIALSLSAFVLSFIVFSIQQSGQQFLLGFGAQGVRTFVTLFPWTSLVFDIAVLFVLEWLLQSFRFGYRFSLFNLFVAVMVASGTLALIVNATPLHRALLDRADRGELPIVGQMYEDIRASHTQQGIFRGTVSTVQGNSVVITHNDLDRDSDDGTRTILLPPGSPAVHVGERVYVLGTPQGEQIEAYGIEQLSSDQ